MRIVCLLRPLTLSTSSCAVLFPTYCLARHQHNQKIYFLKINYEEKKNIVNMQKDEHKEVALLGFVFDSMKNSS